MIMASRSVRYEIPKLVFPNIIQSLNHKNNYRIYNF